MLYNYLKIAWRNLLRHKGYSFINIGGLALGMACSLLMGLWVREELTYNRFLPDVENVHVVYYNLVREGETITNMSTPGPLQEAIDKDIPQVAHVTKVATWPNLLVKKIDRSAKQVITKEQGYYATEAFFDVFPLATLKGNPKAALADPGQIVITRKMADKFFPAGQEALGKQLQLDNNKVYTVGAILADLPTSSTLRFDWIANFRLFEQDWMKVWGDNPFQTYVRLNPAATLAQTEAAMKGIYSRYTDFQSAKEGRIYPILQPITDVYLYNEYQNGKPVGGRIQYVWVFSVIASLVLVVACINFMNLATARSTVRAKEVGVRKALGARRTSLIGQFISESLLTSLLAIGLACGLVYLVLPTFNVSFNKQLTLDLNQPSLWFILIGMATVTGLLAGSYPALFLSGLPPVRTLKGALSNGKGRIKFRQVLVIFQFSLSIFLIVGMLVIGKQVDYLRTKNLGMDRNNVVAIPLEGELLFQRKEAFRQAVLRLPSIASATATSALPMNIQSGSGDLKWPGKGPNERIAVSTAFVGPGFTKTMNIQLLAGRDFRPNSKIDSSSYIINEAAAELMGMQNPIGEKIDFLHGKGPIIGLMKDFHLQSLHQSIAPLVLAFDDRNTSYLLIKIQTGQSRQALTDIERLTKQFNANYPFTYEFLDKAYNKLYKSEQQVAALVNCFGMLTILISCLGLFGLAAYTAEQRTKEIGIRKVLGASVSNIVALLSKDFLKLVLLANLLAWPLAWYGMSRWLANYAYRINLEWWLFGAAGMLAISIVLITVSFQAIKAAVANPVKALRNE